jgi:hypothetical protein
MYHSLNKPSLAGAPPDLEDDDYVYKQALEEKERLERQREEIDARLAEIESFLRLHAQFSPRSEQEQQGISQKEFEALLVEILSQVGHPMSRQSLRDALRIRGVHIGGRNPVKNFGAKLWKAATRDTGMLSYDQETGYRIRSGE